MSQTPAPTAAPRHIDDARVRSLRADCGDAVVSNLIELFAQATPPLLEQLRDSQARGDTGSLMRTAHQLKGSCLSLGASSMASLAAELEHGADPAAAVERLVAAFRPTQDAFALALLLPVLEEGRSTPTAAAVARTDTAAPMGS